VGEVEVVHDTVPNTAAVAELFLGMLGRTHLTAPHELALAVAEQVTVAGGADAVIYLIDHEGHTLAPVPVETSPGTSTSGWDGRGEPDRDIDADLYASHPAEPLSVAGTVAGRCFAATEIHESAADVPGRRRLWLPLLDGTERLGVFALTVPAIDGVAETTRLVWERFAHLVAQLISSKSAYGDTFELVRRSRPMTVGGELQLGLLPPMTFATRGLVISAMREPCYEGGGDAFDYSVGSGVAYVAVIDAMGHGIAASGVAAFTLAACRRARRVGMDLGETYAFVDDALAAQFGGERYSTAVVAQLDLVSGRLSWISAGHPEPLLLRGGRLVKTLSTPPATPLGVGFTGDGVTVGTEQLEPGDRLLFYTDGLPEARQPDGEFFGVERLADFVERAAQDGFPAPETLRRLRHAVLQHQHGDLQDDATAVLVEWRSGADERLLPQTLSLG
jgi:hypothetical protein